MLMQQLMVHLYSGKLAVTPSRAYSWPVDPCWTLHMSPCTDTSGTSETNIMLMQELMVHLCSGDQAAIPQKRVQAGCRSLLNTMGTEDVLGDAPKAADWVSSLCLARTIIFSTYVQCTYVVVIRQPFLSRACMLVAAPC